MKSQNEREMELEDDVISLEREVERLRVALRPFADANIQEHAHRNDNNVVSFSVAFGYTKHGVTLGDFRNARDVLYPPSVK